MMEKLYRIGELAKISNVSQRTIDYYTKLGLIDPDKRSDKNYRYYSDETLSRLKRIESLKKEKYSLEEIKNSFVQWEKVSHDGEVTDKLSALNLHLHQLEKEVKELSPLFDHLKPNQVKQAFKILTPQSAACIEALLILLGKGPLL
jgi:MerR family transcriptional regulator, copper efflux regulator